MLIVFYLGPLMKEDGTIDDELNAFHVISNDYIDNIDVMVIGSQKVGFIAVLYGAVLPMIVMMVAAIITALTTKNELLAVLLGLGALAAYFVCLYFFRDKLKQKLKFEIQ